MADKNIAELFGGQIKMSIESLFKALPYWFQAVFVVGFLVATWAIFKFIPDTKEEKKG